MIIVPDRTRPASNILRDVPTMGEPDHRTGEPGGHAEIIYEDVRVPYENIVGNAGRRLRARPEAARARAASTTPCAGWARAQRAFDMLCERALSRYTPRLDCWPRSR